MRLIDADALVQALHKADTVMGQPHFLCKTVYECINKAPTVDAMPVVRCKDCKYYDTPKNFKKPYCMRGAYVKVNADDYCSKGERK